ncbi:Granulin [Trinorchestia longiramus]|nr:Granulin [Trinorchestia longiramus]
MFAKVRTSHLQHQEDSMLATVKGCLDKNTCCPTHRPEREGCCPYANATCCSDKIHCCPEGSRCDVKRGECVSESTLSLLSIFQNLIRSHQNQLPMVVVTHDDTVVETPDDASAVMQGSVHLEFEGRHYPAVLNALNNGTHLVLVPCPDHSSCPDTYTCCAFDNKSYGCCPYSNAVCCADHATCCPHNTQCTPAGTCRRKN